MAQEALKSAEEWLLEYPDVKIIDPDGWDRDPAKWAASWGERITRAEFHTRLSYCTQMLRTTPDAT